MKAGPVLETLLHSSEPSVRWKARVQVLGESPDSPRLRSLREEIRTSPRVASILRRKGQLGRPGTLRGLYYKWQGAHWALARLADLGYPPNDADLHPMRDRALAVWLGPTYFKEYDAATKAASYRREGVPRENGRYRRCASQQGNCLLYLTQLGLDDGRGEQLVERLAHWQWPDGGWNCARDPAAHVSSFLETLLPMRGLAVYGRATGSALATRIARRAGEVFLQRRLFRRVSDGRVIMPEFVLLHYPTYYYYDVLAGLRGMVEIDRIRDTRCQEALDLLESKRLPDGGWSAEAKLYRYDPRHFAARAEFVNWGGVDSRRMNPWVTADALGVLVAAGRLAV